jgi:hypothetical protein
VKFLLKREVVLKKQLLDSFRFIIPSKLVATTTKKDVTTVKAHVPVPDGNLVSSLEETVVLPKNRGKRSSPQPVRGEGKTDLVKPNIKNKGLDIPFEQPEDHHDKSPAKKPRLGRPGN